MSRPEIPDDLALAVYNDTAGLAAFAHDGDDEVSVLEPSTGRTIATVEPDTGYVLGLAISNDGTRLYTAGQIGPARVFALPSGKQVGELVETRNVLLSPDGTLLVGAEFDGVITFYDPITLERIGDPLTGSTAFSPSLQFTPDGRFLITTGLENLLRIWDVETRLQVGPAIPVTESRRRHLAGLEDPGGDDRCRPAADLPRPPGPAPSGVPQRRPEPHRGRVAPVHPSRDRPQRSAPGSSRTPRRGPWPAGWRGTPPAR